MIPEKDIIIPIEFDPMADYWALRFSNGKRIQRINLEGIYRFLTEEIELDEAGEYDVMFWQVTKVGHHLKYLIPGDIFLNKAKTKIIDKMTRYDDGPPINSLNGERFYITNESF